MPDYPPLSTQVIGQTESALGALLEPLLARTGITFQQWLVLTVTAATGVGIDRGQLAARISNARKVDRATVEAAIAELAAAGLVAAGGPGARTEAPVTLTDAGRAKYQSIRSALEEITTGLFDFPAEDLATAGRVLSVVTERANAVLAGPRTSTGTAR
jgi:DNA-binding MarR family transcriptional regulator